MRTSDETGAQMREGLEVIAIRIWVVLRYPTVTDSNYLQVVPIQIAVHIQDPLLRNILAFGHLQPIVVQVDDELWLYQLDILRAQDAFQAAFVAVADAHPLRW